MASSAWILLELFLVAKQLFPRFHLSTWGFAFVFNFFNLCKRMVVCGCHLCILMNRLFSFCIASWQAFDENSMKTLANFLSETFEVKKRIYIKTLCVTTTLKRTKDESFILSIFITLEKWKTWSFGSAITKKFKIKNFKHKVIMNWSTFENIYP